MTGSPATDETLGPYRIVRRIGGGGMGVVYEAYDAFLRRPVALKVIAPHLAEDPGFRARFTREARALAALDSAHVVQVYAHGEQDGRLYLATQLVPDGDLGQLLRADGPPAPAVALDLVAQVAAGLADAHAAGLVHRDIKPGNVLLRRRGTALEAYLTDFGIARRLDSDQTRSRGEGTGGTVGTPAYQAPELHTGGAAGVATDIYALGCLLWTTLTGRVPYPGDSDYQVAAAHLEQPVPQVAGDGPLAGEVNRILRTAMAKDPARRHPTAAALRDELLAARSLPSSRPAREGPRPGRRARGMLAAVLVLPTVLVAGGAAYVVGRGDDEPRLAVQPSGLTSARTVDVLAVATASLADALEAQGAMSRRQAVCTAERWIAGAGLPEMSEAGFFDVGWTYVDQDRAAMTPQIRAAAGSAASACGRG